MRFADDRIRESFMKESGDLAGDDRLSTAPLSGKVAGPTRLELATSGVTGRRSNQLNYDPTCSKAPNDSAFHKTVQD